MRQRIASHNDSAGNAGSTYVASSACPSEKNTITTAGLIAASAARGRAT